MRLSKSQKIVVLILCPLITFLIGNFYYNFKLIISVLLVVGTEIFLILSFFFEKLSDKKDEKLQCDIESGKYGESEEWQKKYLQFVNEKGFERVKASSMRGDLHKRYLRPMGVFMIVLAIIVLLLGVIVMPEILAKIFFGVVSCGLCAYGIYCLSMPQVRDFLKWCGDNYSSIDASYMGGKQLTYRKKIADEFCNDGINIGSNWVVIYNTEEIGALRHDDIIGVKHRILRVKYYGNDIYTGTKYAHYIDVTVRDPYNGYEKTFSAQLAEFQAELACRTLSAYQESNRVKHTSTEKNDFIS